MSTLELIGWLGAGSLLVGFALNLFQKIHADSITYLLLNLIGSLLLLYNAYMNGAFPFVAVNFVWVVFSVFKLVQIRMKA
ncbi:CBU_0592 family membrane protein [Ekhidna sp. To15]|uniref:CBU_0592 family membrane protein n=1 Tax=Ekhidna sp. To15 TaxID=3395267 RepID=UPI003F51C94B